MNAYIPNFLTYFSVLILLFLSAYICGRVSMAVINGKGDAKNPISGVFFSLLVGATEMITVFAIIWTKGNTIMLLSALLLLFMLVVGYKKHSVSKVVISKRELLSVVLALGVFVFLFVVVYLSFFIGHKGMSRFGDTLFYSNVSSTIIENHVESSKLFDAVSPTPYHYGEFWLNGMLAHLFGLSYYNSLFLLTYVYFLAMCSIGAMGLVRHFTDKKWLVVMFGFMFLMFAPFTANVLFYCNHILYGKTFELSYPVLTFFKLSPVCVILLAFANAVLSDKKDFAFGMLLLMTSLYLPAAPATLIFLFFYSVIVEKPFWEKKFFVFNRYVLVAMLFGLLVILFYYLNSSGSNSTKHIASSNDGAGLDMVPAMILAMKWLVMETVVFIPTVILVWWMFKKNDVENLKIYYRYVVAIFVSFVFVDLLGGIASLLYIDGEQLTNNFVIQAINIFSFVGMVYVSTKFKKRIGYSVIVLSVLLFLIIPQRGILYHQFNMKVDKDYVEKVKGFVETIENASDCDGDYRFGYFACYGKRYGNNHCMRLHADYPLDECMHLLRKDGVYIPYCLSALDIPDDIDPKFNEKKSSQLYRFIKKQRDDVLYVSDVQSISDFINCKGINTIVVEDGSNVSGALLEGFVLVADFEGNKVYKVK